MDHRCECQGREDKSAWHHRPLHNQALLTKVAFLPLLLVHPAAQEAPVDKSEDPPTLLRDAGVVLISPEQHSPESGEPEPPGYAERPPTNLRPDHTEHVVIFTPGPASIGTSRLPAKVCAILASKING